MGKLTAVDAKSKVAKGRPGAHADGGNLYLRVTGPGAAKWTFRFMRHGKSREMGLGGFEDVTLASARLLAEDARRRLRDGDDPIASREDAKVEARIAEGRTFREIAGLYITAHEKGWRNAKHAAQWTSTLRAHVYPTLGDKPVSQVSVGDVMSVLEPLWHRVPETASRVRGRIEAVLDFATARGWRAGDNPARWRGHLANLLPARSKVARVEHFAALPWGEIGEFLAALRSREGIAARALEFTILTAARSGETRGATWREIDLQASTWTVPGARMKAGVEHRVPLSAPALAILRGLIVEPLDPAALVFPSSARGRVRQLSDAGMSAVLRRMGQNAITVHGFRSAFRDWASERTGYAREVVEMALAHTVGDKVEAAYRRGDLFNKRLQLMADWATYCGQVAEPVQPIRKSAT
jgi:integrase